MSMYISYKGLFIFLLEVKCLWQLPPELGWLFPLHKSTAFLLGLREPPDPFIPFWEKKNIIKGLLNNLTSGKKKMKFLQGPSGKTRDYTNIICQQIHIDRIKVVLPSNCHISLQGTWKVRDLSLLKENETVAVWPDRLHMGKYTTELHFSKGTLGNESDLENLYIPKLDIHWGVFNNTKCGRS